MCCQFKGREESQESDKSKNKQFLRAENSVRAYNAHLRALGIHLNDVLLVN